MRKVLLYSAICFFIVFILGIASVIVYKSCPLCVDELKEIGPAGDAIAGLSAIVLGALGVAATFAAFYIQYQANVSLHKDSLKEGYDRKFFELIHLFAQSTNNLRMKVRKKQDFRDKTGNPYEYIEGKNVFQKFHDQFSFAFDQLNAFLRGNNLPLETVIPIAFSITYYEKNHPNIAAAIDHLENNFVNLEEKNVNETWDIAFVKAKIDSLLNNYNFGHEDASYNEILCHYFKQLYFIVKFIFDSKDVSDEQKKNYFNMLRGQLSFNEQLMLLYSWCARLDGELDDSQMKKVFTEYGLINDILACKTVDEIDVNAIINN